MVAGCLDKKEKKNRGKKPTFYFFLVSVSGVMGIDVVGNCRRWSGNSDGGRCPRSGMGWWSLELWGGWT
jgi:hypothetical protein